MVERLADRHSDILDIIISDYISSALPVGSRTISKKYGARLSPATIRNVMADLTELGLLAQPHTSAGRIPTVVGMRYYVDTLLKQRSLTDEEREAIRERCKGDDSEVEGILGRTSKILANVSRYAGLVVMPDSCHVMFKQIEFVPLSRNKILGILVSQDGRVDNRLIEIDEDLSYSELERISNYCTSSFLGLSLDDAMQKISKELESDYVTYDKLIKKALKFSKLVFEGVPRSEIVINGEKQLLDFPEFSDSDKFKKLLEELEEKSKILRLLERCRESENVRIFVGLDSEESGTADVSLIGAPYRVGKDIVGVVGVIGPMRMDYSSVVPIVDFTAKVLGDVLEA